MIAHSCPCSTLTSAFPPGGGEIPIRKQAVVRGRGIWRVQNGNRSAERVAEELRARGIALARQNQLASQVRGSAQKQADRERQPPPENIVRQVRERLVESAVDLHRSGRNVRRL